MALPWLASDHISVAADAASVPGLREAAKVHGIFYGCAVKSGVLKDDAGFAGAVLDEAGMLVPEYELKRGTVEAKPGVYDFSGSDRLLDFAPNAWADDARPHTCVACGEP